MCLLKVGDVVMTNKKGTNRMVPAVITRIDGGYVDILFSDGSIGWRREERVKPTRRHISDINSVLDMIRYGGESDAKGT